MKSGYLRILYVLLLSLFVSSCINLKHLHTYATESGTALATFEQTGYSFENHCMDRCYSVLIKNQEIERAPVCACGKYKEADEAVHKIYATIAAYFTALAKLSENDLTQIQTAALFKTITAGEFGSIQITDEQVKAIGDISSILLRSVTEHYRRKQIRELVQKADSPLQVVLTKFNFIITQNLSGEIDFRKAELYDLYKELSVDKKASSFEKMQEAKNYYTELQDLQKIQEGIQLLSKSLNRIAEGHHQISLHADKLDGTELAQKILQISADVDILVNSFNQLRN